MRDAEGEWVKHCEAVGVHTESYGRSVEVGRGKMAKGGHMPPKRQKRRKRWKRPFLHQAKTVKILILHSAVGNSTTIYMGIHNMQMDLFWFLLWQHLAEKERCQIESAADTTSPIGNPVTITTLASRHFFTPRKNVVSNLWPNFLPPWDASTTPPPIQTATQNKNCLSTRRLQKGIQGVKVNPVPVPVLENRVNFVHSLRAGSNDMV